MTLKSKAGDHLKDDGGPLDFDSVNVKKPVRDIHDLFALIDGMAESNSKTAGLTAQNSDVFEDGVLAMLKLPAAPEVHFNPGTLQADIYKADTGSLKAISFTFNRYPPEQVRAFADALNKKYGHGREIAELGGSGKTSDFGTAYGCNEQNFAVIQAGYTYATKVTVPVELAVTLVADLQHYLAENPNVGADLQQTRNRTEEQRRAEREKRATALAAPSLCCPVIEAGKTLNSAGTEVDPCKFTPGGGSIGGGGASGYWGPPTQAPAPINHRVHGQ